MIMMTSAHETDVLEVVSELVRERRAGLCALARHEGLGPEDAVDCVQEALCTFLTAMQNGSAPADRAAWAPVLATMVRNAARNRRRRHFIARPHAELDQGGGAVAPGAAIDELVARAEEHVRLRACVAELCEIQKSVVTLRMLEERAGEDVARALGISPGHVAVLLHRAKAALRACMTQA
jgi:RNA polymerase sigma-70 factor (ECF subfamily)